MTFGALKCPEFYLQMSDEGLSAVARIFCQLMNYKILSENISDETEIHKNIPGRDTSSGPACSSGSGLPPWGPRVPGARRKRSGGSRA
jgi:hypothetical protein